MSDERSLRELVSISSEIESSLIMAGGEITPEIEAALAITEVQVPQKIDNYNLIMERMEAISSFYEERASLFLRLAAAAKNVKKKCTENIHVAMLTLGVDELQGFDTKFRLQNNPAGVELIDEALIPDAYKIVKTVTSVDKKKILDDLKLGVPVAGAEMKQGTHVRSYANNKAR